MDVLAPIDHSNAPGRMTVDELERILTDLKGQPNWRVEADVEADFYDGNQLDSAALAKMEERGIPPTITNLIGPTIDTVLGMEARTRRDWRVRADDDSRQAQDVAEALNEKLHEIERMTRADRACSDAYAGQVKVGIHWVEVGRNSNPFEYPYRALPVNRREIWWDWRAVMPDLSDARYLVRKKWYDVDELIMYFPNHKELIRHSMTNYSNWDWLTMRNVDPLLVRDFVLERDVDIDDADWRDTERERAALHEIWYKVFHRGYVLRLPNGAVMEFQKDNVGHRAAVQSGRVKVEQAVYPKIRLSYWIGPHRLIDIPNPNPFNRFPYVAFMAKREDRTGVPYGMIRAMKPQQEEVNARRSRMMWSLLSKRIIADADAVHNNDWGSVMREIARPDAVIKLNPERANRDSQAFQVEEDTNVSKEQFEIYQDARNTIQDVANVFKEMMGKKEGQMSGVAIASLVEQGITTLGEINDNYQHAREQVGDMLLSLAKEDMVKQVNIPVTLGKNTPRRRKVFLNHISQDEQGRRIKKNDMVMIKTAVELDEVPNSSTYRQQQLHELTEMTKNLPDELKAVIMPMIIEGSDMRGKYDIADILRKATGQSIPMRGEEDDLSEEELAELKAQEEQQKKQAMAEELALKEQAAQVEKLAGEIKKLNAEVEKIRAETVTDQMQADQLAIEESQNNFTKNLLAELDAMERTLIGQNQGGSQNAQSS